MATIIIDIGKRQAIGGLSIGWQCYIQTVVRFHHVGIDFPGLVTLVKCQYTQGHVQGAVISHD